MASDGVFDKLSNKEAVEIIWGTIAYYKTKLNDLTAFSSHVYSECVNNVLKKALMNGSDTKTTTASGIAGYMAGRRMRLFTIAYLATKQTN